MKYLSNCEEEEAKKFLGLTIELAKDATCTRAKCGSLIVKEGKIIGKGYKRKASFKAQVLPVME